MADYSEDYCKVWFYDYDNDKNRLTDESKDGEQRRFNRGNVCQFFVLKIIAEQEPTYIDYLVKGIKPTDTLKDFEKAYNRTDIKGLWTPWILWYRGYLLEGSR